VSGFQLFNLR